MSRRDLDSLLAYLRENSGGFPMPRLREQMLKAGHAPSMADLAIGVYEGRLPEPERPVWPLVLWVTGINFALAGLCAFLFTELEKSVACSAVALLPILYFIEFITGLALLSSRERKSYRQGRALLLGVLTFVGLAALLLVFGAVRYLSQL